MTVQDARPVAFTRPRLRSTLIAFGVGAAVVLATGYALASIAGFSSSADRSEFIAVVWLAALILGLFASTGTLLVIIRKIGRVHPLVAGDREARTAVLSNDAPSRTADQSVRATNYANYILEYSPLATVQLLTLLAAVALGSLFALLSDRWVAPVIVALVVFVAIAIVATVVNLSYIRKASRFLAGAAKVGNTDAGDPGVGSTPLP